MRRAALAVMLVTGCNFYDSKLEQCISSGRCIDDSADGSTVNNQGLGIHDPLEFGQVPINGVGGVLYRPLFAQNGVSVDIHSVTTTGGFTIEDDAGCSNTTLFHESCNLEIGFRPTSKADGDGGLHFETSVGPIDFPLHGTPVVVALELDSQPRDLVVAFDPQAQNPNYLNRDYRIFNTGEVDVQYLGVYAMDPDAGWSANVSGIQPCNGLPADGGGTCFLRVTFTPTRIGPSALVVPVQVNLSGGSIFFNFAFTGRGAQTRKLVFVNEGDGSGQINVPGATDTAFLGPLSSSAPIDVPDLYVLHLSEKPGAVSGFGGWDAGTCGLSRTCDLLIDGGNTYAVGVSFARPNYVFRSTATLTPPFDGATADALCASQATTFSYPGHYVAVLALDAGTLREPLSTARGFARADDLAPLADTADDFVAGRLWNTVALTVPGFNADGGPADTATFWTGAPQANCGDWSGTGAAASFGYSGGDSQDFVSFGPAQCTQTRALLCAANDRTLVVDPPVVTSGVRLAFVTEQAVPATYADPDALCAAEALDAGLVGHGADKGFFAFRTPSQGSTHFSSDFGDWSRVDGTPALPSSFASSLALQNPVSVTARGTHPPGAARVWLGVTQGGGVLDCNGWSSTSSSGAYVLRASAVGAPIETLSCGGTAALLCLQE